MQRQPSAWRHGLLLGLWFAAVVGLVAGLGDSIRLYAALRSQRQQLQAEVQRLQRELTVLQNKLAFLNTPEGIRLVQRAQCVNGDGEKLLVVERGLPLVSLMDLIPGGIEEWHDSGQRRASLRNRWLVRLSRHWQRLRGDRSP